MPLSPFRKYGGRDYEGQRDQANNQAVFDQLTSNPLMGGVVSTFKTSAMILAGVDFTLNHGLGRALTAPPISLLQPVAGNVYVSPNVSQSPTTQLILRCSGPIPSGTTLSFYVF
jgi:hypothetical protein